ncbi:MAG: PAS domain S-box protein [Gemmatimonadales bacterium]|nr:PAS domain S-box protein [Gemmatimonadales bacterium]
MTVTTLLDTPPEEAFDRLTRMAARLLGAPVALVTLVTDDRQFFKSAIGLAEPWASLRGTPLAYSFCRHVVAAGEPLVVEDARLHPLLRATPALREFGWISYAGVPLTTADGQVLGTLSVVDAMPRLWSERDMALLRDLGALALNEIELRSLPQGPEQPAVFEDCGIAMAICSSDGHWVRVNRALSALLGYADHELVGTPVEQHTHPDDRAADREAIRLLLAGECNSYTADKRFLRASGSPAWVSVTVAVVFRGSGLSHHFLTCIQDISDRKRAEAALQESEERYRFVIRATNDAAWDWDLLTDRIVWGEGAGSLFGYPQPSPGTTASWWYERVHAEDRERVVGGIHAAIERGAPTWQEEYRFRRADGTWAQVTDRGYVVSNDSGEPVRMIGALADVTQRKRTEELVRGQSRLLERIAAGQPLVEVLDQLARFAEEHSDGGIALLMLLDPGADRMRLASAPNLPEAYRSAPEGMLVDPAACWSAPILATTGEMLGSFALYYGESKKPAAAELRIGEIATHLAGIAVERERNLEALHRSTRLLQQVLETLPVGVWVLDQEGRIVFSNPASHQIRGGVGIEELEQYRGWWVETGEPIGPDQWAAVRAVRHGESTLNQLVRIQGSDGSEKTLLSSALPIRRPDGEILGAIVLNQDVTEREASEATLRLSREHLQHARQLDAVGQLAGGIAHDFNNLLTGVLSYCDLLLQELGQGDPLRTDIEQIRHAGKRAATLTRQLLAFSRRQILRPKVLSLNSVVEDLEPMLRQLLGAEVSLAVELDPGLAPVMADPGQLEQVMVNLVVNARDAMPQGGQVTISTANRELHVAEPGVPAGAYAVLTVRDTGVGMAPSTRARVFEPFFTTKEPGKGTGLGLSSVYGIVEQSGGHITVESSLAEGATFTIYLRKHAGPERSQAKKGQRKTLPLGTETILLVEDETAVRNSARRLLERHGYTVLEARHGVDALRLLEETGRNVDLVLSDVVMPEMGGRELVERLRAERPQLKVVYMSGYTEQAITSGGVLPPRTAFLEKPFTVDQLMRLVRELLDE